MPYVPYVFAHLQLCMRASGAKDKQLHNVTMSKLKLAPCGLWMLSAEH